MKLAKTDWLLLLLCLGVVVPGCRKQSESTAPKSQRNNQPAKEAVVGPAASAIKPTLDQGWCGGHGVPESVCTRCNASLIATFKEAGDWCEAHGLPESQCVICHPEIKAEWAKLNPANKGTSSPPAPEVGPAASAIKPTLDQGWCGGHGVPESVCTRCNASLITTFKEAGDWCEAHGLPESQCTLCHPEVKAEWDKLNPAKQQEPDQGGAALTQPPSRLAVEPRLVTGGMNPLCPVENVRVRFASADIVHKAGIQVERAQRRPMSVVIDVPAEVEFDATRLTRITPLAGGVVRQVPVAVGDTVAEHDLLAVLDSPVLGEAKSLYIERVQDLKLAEADVLRVTTIARGIRLMIQVCAPQSSPAEIREALAESPVGEAKARLLRAHAALQLARSNVERQTTLFDKDLSSERDYQAAHSALASAEIDFIALKEEIAFTAEREELTARRAVEVARSALDSAERALHILGLTDEQISAIGSEPDEQLTRFELRSPVDGRIIERHVAVGESVQTDCILFAVADTTTMWLIADIYERDLLQMRRGLPVLFSVDGLPGVSFEGSLTFISSQLNDKTRTVSVRAELPNRDGLLRAKMFGRAHIIVHDQDSVITVPKQAVQTDGCCQLVFVRESETVYQPRKVILGAAAGGYAEVLKGLTEGEIVAGAGSFLMKTEILKSNIGAGCCEVDPGR